MTWVDLVALQVLLGGQAGWNRASEAGEGPGSWPGKPTGDPGSFQAHAAIAVGQGQD